MGAIRDVLRVPDCRRIEAGWFASLAGELAGSIALLVYAYNEGGAALVAAYGVVRTLPAMLITPGLVSSSDRFGPDRVLRITVGSRAVLLAVAAIGAFVGAPSFLVIGAGAIGSWMAGAYRPIQASVLPWLALSGRYDKVVNDTHDDCGGVPCSSYDFSVVSPRIILRTDWQATDQIVIQYSHWFNGANTLIRVGDPPMENINWLPDKDMVSLSANMWW